MDKESLKNLSLEVSEKGLHFQDFIYHFVSELSPNTIVEIDADRKFGLAQHLQRHCKKYITVSDHDKWGGVELYLMDKKLEKLNRSNQIITAKSGNPLELSKTVTKADLILLDNVELENQEKAYKDFLKVAQPGYIVSYMNEIDSIKLKNLLNEKLGVSENMIYKIDFKVSSTNKKWSVLVIDNTQQV